MKTSACFAALALALLPLAAAAQTAAPADLSVTGTGTVSRPADVATFTVTITTSDDAMAGSNAKGNAIYDELRAKLSSVGVPESSIRIRGYALQTGGRATATQTFTVETSVGSVGKAIDAAVAAGATTVTNVQFGIKNRKAAYGEALAAAVADARNQAAILAEAAGVKIIRIRSISSGSFTSRIVEMIGDIRSAASSFGSALPGIAGAGSPPGPVDVTASVTITYVIQQP